MEGEQASHKSILPKPISKINVEKRPGHPRIPHRLNPFMKKVPHRHSDEKEFGRDKR